MKTEVSRRGFIKTAGVATGVMLATGFSPFSYAQNEKVRVASIGTGGQGSFHLRDGLSRANNIKIIAVCDVYKPHLEGGYKNAGGGDVKKYMDYREMIEKEQLDAVVISTPLATHYQITMDCLDAGLYCFTEKTMCFTIEQCRDVVKKAHEKGLFVQVGHQRRYNPVYNHALKLAREEGVLGRITHIDCQWHRNNDWRRPVDKNYVLSPEESRWIKDLERHLNWRLYHETSGGLMTELGTHAFDVVNWFLGARPTRVHGYGSLDYWRDGRDVFDHANVVFEYHVTPECPGYRQIEPRTTQQKEYGKYNEPYNVGVTYSSICTNMNRGAAECIQGDEGTFVLAEMMTPRYYREPNSRVKWAESGARGAAEANATIISEGKTLTISNKAQSEYEPILVDTDKSVDQIQFEHFARDIQKGGPKNGAVPRANEMVGLESAICALAADKAMWERSEVIIDPKWYEFDFETPSTSLYGPIEV